MEEAVVAEEETTAVDVGGMAEEEEDVDVPEAMMPRPLIFPPRNGMP
jgi:hypothetical protein